MDSSEGTGKGIVAERLDCLFATVTLLGRPYSLHEVADGINAQAGRTVLTFQYLSQLRRGERRRPSFDKLQAIATWFGVNAEYFTDDEPPQRTPEERRFLDLMRDPRVRRLAFLAKDLESEDLKRLIGMVELMCKANGLPPAVDPDEEPCPVCGQLWRPGTGADAGVRPGRARSRVARRSAVD